MNDKKILELFKNGQREKAFSKLYALYPKIEALIISKGGQKQDASDVFQEALIILHRNLEKSDFKLTSSFYTYLYSVSRFVWKDIQNKFSKEELHNLDSNEVEYFHNVLEEKNYQLAEIAFLELGERCQELLRLFYQKAKSFKEIAIIMQFASEKVAKNQKYKCLAKAKDIYQASKTIQS
ncbi:RNA polymerase sigma factor [Confluentibacter flavum]|uniref:Sigma-70 family RNA polymerase sigma factor n=1 Tax=Confluentibacter flavum TaxID=1909700 RepID=A0A2N3HL07_9FLAO|nr:sigma-70 family RNA polymerase sigma factor [Confluentibacter flavum]PKQ45655.1 sigma-70 family RNA polymerase sigma factor [Confluentibacter flavum]